MVKRLIPKSLDLPLRYYYKRLTGTLDFELTVLRDESPNCSVAIDIGTNIGIYSYGFSRFCKRVESFEPVAECTRMLKAYAEHRENIITIHAVGLSNQAGNVNLYVPTIAGSSTPNVGLASVNDPGGGRVVMPIVIRRLDDYNFAHVDIIKVDVEGHELEVLEGSVETILREKPLLLVEIEQRHLKGRTIEDVFGFILSLGYSGGYYFKKRYYPLESFSYEIHQKPFLENVFSSGYINNFIFRPIEK